MEFVCKYDFRGAKQCKSCGSFNTAVLGRIEDDEEVEKND